MQVRRKKSSSDRTTTDVGLRMKTSYRAVSEGAQAGPIEV